MEYQPTTKNSLTIGEFKDLCLTNIAHFKDKCLSEPTGEVALLMAAIYGEFCLTHGLINNHIYEHGVGKNQKFEYLGAAYSPDIEIAGMNNEQQAIFVLQYATRQYREDFTQSRADILGTVLMVISEINRAYYNAIKIYDPSAAYKHQREMADIERVGG